MTVDNFSQLISCTWGRVVGVCCSTFFTERIRINIISVTQVDLGWFLYFVQLFILIFEQTFKNLVQAEMSTFKKPFAPTPHASVTNFDVDESWCISRQKNLSVAALRRALLYMESRQICEFASRLPQWTSSTHLNDVSFALTRTRTFITTCLSHITCTHVSDASFTLPRAHTFVSFTLTCTHLQGHAD